MISALSDVCDCHVHVFGDPASTPMLASRGYTPPAASVEALGAHMQRMGATRCVLVQPSVYGTDTTVMVDAIARLGDAARGICVVEENANAEDLVRLDAAGVRGVRLNMESASLTDPQAIRAAIERWADSIGPLGWHLQIYAGFEAVLAAAEALQASSLPIVIDHFAMMPLRSAEEEKRSIERAIDLLTRGSVHMKCSGFYRLPGATPEVLSRVTHALHEAAPTRLVWASDWPHTNKLPGLEAHEISPFRTIDPDDLVANAQLLFAGGGMAEDILVRNPARLYGFS